MRCIRNVLLFLYPFLQIKTLYNCISCVLKYHLSYSKHIQVENLEPCFSQTKYHAKITLHCIGPRTTFNGTATLPLNPQMYLNLTVNGE